MDSPQDLLQQALTLPNGSRLKNRLAKSAMSEALGTTDNHATEALVHLYGRWAAGGRIPLRWCAACRQSKRSVVPR